ncbi:MAG TPA: hypothetical protein PLZ52_07415 [Bacteroidales bacterium]|nr:hypothetical protein [Bacteroidales bacterium]HQL69583.1 hypothetical protein [Bacteroidales bacterium]HUM89728.1 hypothetical protein [Prolixibacteraceae bacterium]
MEKKYQWKKGFFSEKCILFSENAEAGHFNDKSFSQTATAVLNGVEYRFRTRGFFKQHTTISDASGTTCLGEITYNSWMNKAHIKLQEESFEWKYENFWGTRWQIAGNDTLIQYTGSSSKGSVNSNQSSELLILCGLAAMNYYRQISVAIIVAVFVPLWISLSH